MRPPTISKSQFVKGIQCPKALWLFRHRKDLIPPIDPATQARFDAGNEIGEWAMHCFEGGVEVKEDYWDIVKAEAATSDFITRKFDTIYEATAIHPDTGAYSRIDILRKNNGKWDLIEVKSSTSVKGYHITDLSFQRYVFEGAGYEIGNCYMMLIDNEFVREGAIDVLKFFKLDDISEDVQLAQEFVVAQVPKLISMLNSDEPPNVEISPHCTDPFECDFREHCWAHVPDYSVFDIYGKKSVGEVVAEINSYEIRDIPEHLLPSGVKALDVAAFQRNETLVNSAQLQDWVKELQYPLYFLDYETIMPAIPLYDGTRPYQQIPFQFSLHIQREADGELEHFEFIHREKIDPRRAFAERLVELCGNEGSVIVYNQGFETARNRELAIAFPDLMEGLLGINERVIDLLVPFKKRWLYSPEQKSSASIKAVLPAFTDLGYEGLDIANGGDAMERYFDFAKGKLKYEDEPALWDGLSQYCELDTLAMVELLEVLHMKVKQKISPTKTED